jgi:hypothetical protein
MATGRPSSPDGCYGFRLPGLDAAHRLLVQAPPTWPALEVLHAPPGAEPPEMDRIGPDHARVALHRGWVELDRAAARVSFHMDPPPPDGDLIHPFFAPVAAVAARWAGRDSFHAGAVIVDGGAWAVLGEKEDGKSTTLAWFALNGHPVLTDDLLVLDGETALAGPRCIDLREESSARFGVGEPLGIVGHRERWRLVLDGVPAEVPLRGFVKLAWGPDLAVEPLRGPERLLVLLPHRTVRLTPPSPADTLDLSSLPVWRLSRPRSWDALPDAANLLLDKLAA